MERRRKKNLKDKKVRAYNGVIRSVWGFERVFKHYIHSEESGGLWAYARQLSERERYTANAMQIDEDTLFEITHSPKITTDLFLEFNDKTYKIVSIDPFEYNKTDLVIRAKEIATPTYDEVEYDEY